MMLLLHTMAGMVKYMTLKLIQPGREAKQSAKQTKISMQSTAELLMEIWWTTPTTSNCFKREQII